MRMDLAAGKRRSLPIRPWRLKQRRAMTIEKQVAIHTQKALKKTVTRGRIAIQIIKAARGVQIVSSLRELRALILRALPQGMQNVLSKAM
jgi:hypothetical protein